MANSTGYNSKVYRFQRAAMEDGVKFTVYGHNGRWTPECEGTIRRDPVKLGSKTHISFLVKKLLVELGYTMYMKSSLVMRADTEEIKEWQKDVNLEVTGMINVVDLRVLLGVDKTEIIFVTPAMPRDQIQTIFKKPNVKIIVQPGRYNVSKTYILYSNTDIVIKKDAFFVKTAGGCMFSTEADENTTGYDGVHDLRISGEGTIIANYKKSFNNVMAIIHAKNITISGIKFLDCYCAHVIEINSSSNVDIYGVNFNNHMKNDGNWYKETIQIDFAMYSALSYSAKTDAKCYDNTHCANISIINNIFEKCSACIGTHTQSNSLVKHDTIKITDNIAYGLGIIENEGSFVKLVNMKNVYIKRNKATNFARSVQLYSGSNYFNTDGTVDTVPPEESNGNMNVTISDNHFVNLCDKYQAPFIFTKNKGDLTRHENIGIRNNTFESIKTIAVKYCAYMERTDLIKFEATNTFNGVPTNKTKLFVEDCTDVIV